ncbi:MAG: hypothetical protein KDC79_02415 [Cyclobacteriaceae bacterium]|nr:hypothetical protein [Cyclobacteriaceae bacterium]
MKRVLFLLIIFFQCSSAFAQFSMEEYLSNAISDTELQFFKSRQDFIDENGFKSPILREVEFRARVNNFEDGFDDYRLRFSPLNPLERSANKNYRDEVRQQLSLSYLLNLEEVLLARYEIMIDHWQLTQEKALAEVNIEFYTSLLVLIRDQNSPNNIKDFISMDKALLDAQLLLEDIQNEISILEDIIRKTYDFSGSIEWTEEALVEMKTIKEWMENQNALDLSSNLMVKNAQQKIAVSQSEYKVQKQESFSNIGYLQAEYRENDKNTFGQNLGMQIGVSIPVTNPNKPDLARKEMKLIEDNQKVEQEKTDLENRFENMAKHLDSKLNKYDLVMAKIKTYEDASFTLDKTGNTIDVLVELQKFRSDMTEKKLSLAGAIYKDYINLISINYGLSSAPYINYLSKTNASIHFELDY